MKKIATTLLALFSTIAVTGFCAACNNSDNEEQTKPHSVTAEEWETAFTATLGAENVTRTHTMEYKAYGVKNIGVVKLNAANLAVSVTNEFIEVDQVTGMNNVISYTQDGEDIVRTTYTRETIDGQWDAWNQYTYTYEKTSLADAKGICIEYYGCDNKFYAALPFLKEKYTTATFNADTVTYSLSYDLNCDFWDWRDCRWTLQFAGKKLIKVQIEGKEIGGDGGIDFTASLEFIDFGTTSINIPVIEK